MVQMCRMLSKLKLEKVSCMKENSEDKRSDNYRVPLLVHGHTEGEYAWVEPRSVTLFDFVAFYHATGDQNPTLRRQPAIVSPHRARMGPARRCWKPQGVVCQDISQHIMSCLAQGESECIAPPAVDNSQKPSTDRTALTRRWFSRLCGS